MYMMVLGRTITVSLADPSEVYEWLMSNPATPSTEDNMDAVGVGAVAHGARDPQPDRVGVRTE